MNRRRIALVVAALSILGAGVLAQEGGLARVRELFISSRYAEAADALEATPAGGVERRWGEARLTVDPERFQELGLRDPVTPESRAGGFKPAAVVLVTTVRALRYHGGADHTAGPNLEAVKTGLANVEAHLDGMKNIGLPLPLTRSLFRQLSYDILDFRA